LSRTQAGLDAITLLVGREREREGGP
jgi:hypothetical protein